MFKHTSGAESRLRDWRAIRQSELSLDYILEQFATIPVETRYIDYYTAAEWPDVFDIVSEGMFCHSGITLILAATLHHKGFISGSQMEFLVISSNIDGTTGLVLLHNDQVFNFVPGQVVSLEYVTANAVIYDRHIVEVSQIFS